MTPRGPSAAVRIARDAFPDIVVTVADGMSDAGRAIIETAATRAPDSPYDPYPIGEGLPKQGGVLAYIGNRKVYGWSQRGEQPKKPKSLRTIAKEFAIVVAVGFGFPGRFAEGGTIKMPGQPFLAPTRNEFAPRIPEFVRDRFSQRFGS